MRGDVPSNEDELNRLTERVNRTGNFITAEQLDEVLEISGVYGLEDISDRWLVTPTEAFMRILAAGKCAAMAGILIGDATARHQKLGSAT